MNGNCEVWESHGLELFEYLVMSFIAFALTYWGLRKVFIKKVLLEQWWKRKEEAKNKVLQRMKDAIAKQGMIVTEAAIDMKEKIPEVVPKPVKG